MHRLVRTRWRSLQRAANEIVTIGIPNKELPSRLRYSPGQFFIHKKTPYRGVIIGRVNSTKYTIVDGEAVTDIEQNYYKCLVHKADCDQLKLPPGETEVRMRWDKGTVPTNRNASRFTMVNLKGYDIVSQDDMAPYTPFMPNLQRADASTPYNNAYEPVDVSKVGEEDTQKLDYTEDHRSQFALPTLAEYFDNEYSHKYFQADFVRANPRLNRVLLREKIKQKPEDTDTVHIYEATCERAHITTTLTVRYLDYEEVQLSDDAHGESPQMPRHWWNFNLKIESTANQQVWLTGQTLNITSREHGAQIFPNQMQGKNPRLDAFIQ